MDHPRHRTTRRLRLATAAVAGGALVGTGALTVAVAQAHPAAASSTGSAVTGGTGGTGGSATGTTDQQPSRPGGFGGGHGGLHASSGGS